jgi:hypothetical protein
MLKKLIIGLAAGAVFAAGAIALSVNSRLERTLPYSGQELVKVVGVVGTILNEISQSTIEDLIKVRDQAIKRLRGPLAEKMESIVQLLHKGKPVLDLKTLGESKRAALLRHLPVEQRKEIETDNRLAIMTAVKIYEIIRTQVQRDAGAFEKALGSVSEKPTDDQITEVGKQRGSLTQSLANLVEFSGAMQQLAFTN